MFKKMIAGDTLYPCSFFSPWNFEF